MSDQTLYFIAIVPPDPIYKDVTGMKQYFAEEYHAKAALRSPPHITLHMPFKFKEEKEERIFKVLEKVATSNQPVDLVLHGFGAFKPRVIFINIEESEALARLHDDLKKEMKLSLNIFNAEYKDRGFHPHLTLAFRDLKKSDFFEAWKEFEEKAYHAEFVMDRITLLKHNGKSWDRYKDLEMKK